MSSLVLMLVTGVGLGALYFLVASGLSLIYGLMHVLNFAHGAFLTAGAYAAWVAMGTLRRWRRLGACSSPCRSAWWSGAVVALVVEFFLIRPLYRRHIEQVLVTVGLSLDGGRAVHRASGERTRARTPRPGWTARRRRRRRRHPERPLPADRRGRAAARRAARAAAATPGSD